MKRIRLFATALPLLALLSCTEPTPPPGPDWSGYAAIADEKLLPIRAMIELETDQPFGYFDVAGERTPIPEIRRWGDSLSLNFSEYGAQMIGRLGADRFAGQYYRLWEDTTSFPFVLFRRPEEPVMTPVDSAVAGTYRFILGTGDGADDSSVATLSIDGTRISGTVIHPSGDYGLLEGYQSGESIRLFRFTGWQALYFELTPSEIGYRGRFHVRADPPREVALVRTSADAREVDRVTRLRDPESPFLFSGVTADGAILTSQDAQFLGRPMIIDIMGTWCHNCLDAAPLLQKAYAGYTDDSLQVVSLSFEVHDDPVQGLKNLELFRSRYGIEYPVLFCGSLASDNIEARLGTQFDDFFSYPTTLFVDRSGKVVEIHTGFNGPGTGARWQEQQDEFELAIHRIIES